MKIRWVKFADNESELKKMMFGKKCSAKKIYNKSVLLIYHNNNYYMVKNRCPHQGKTLDHASFEDGMIVCPWHHYGFDLKTGRGHGLHLENYPIEKRDDGYYAAFEYFSLF